MVESGPGMASWQVCRALAFGRGCEDWEVDMDPDKPGLLIQPWRHLPHLAPCQNGQSSISNPGATPLLPRLHHSNTTMTNFAWQDVAKEAQERRDASISRVEPAIPAVPKELPLDRTDIPKYLLSAEEVVITQTAPEDLVVSLASGRYASTAVITAFLRRAGLAQALVHAFAGTNFTIANASRPIALQNSSQSEL